MWKFRFVIPLRFLIWLPFKICYKVIVIETVWHCHKNRHVDQWNKIKDPNMSMCSYIHLIFDRDVKNIDSRKYRQWVWGNLNIHMWKNESRSISITLKTNKLQMNQRPNCETWNTGIARRKHMQYPTGYRCRKGLSEYDP